MQADVLFKPKFEVKHFSNLKLVEDSKLVEEPFEKVEVDICSEEWIHLLVEPLPTKSKAKITLYSLINT